MGPMDYRDFAGRSRSTTLHFWYRARLLLIEAMLRSMPWKQPARILDVGCGTGTEIPLLARHGVVTALDVDTAALREVTTPCTVIEGDITTAALGEGAYDAVCFFDVLEHIRDDAAALRVAHAALAPHGALLITVPAFPQLFSDHDRALAHFRRYTREMLHARLKAAGFEVASIRYWNSLLFPLIAIVRLTKNLFRTMRENPHPVSEASDVPASFMNTLLYHVLALESAGPLAPLYARIPWGLSLVVVARRL